MNSKFRLQKNRDFQRVYRRGRSSSTRLLTLVCVRAPGEIRIGFSVSKKIGNAVARNRARRRLREAVRARLPKLRGGWHVVFIARTGINEADYREICAAVDRLLAQANLLSE